MCNKGFKKYLKIGLMFGFLLFMHKHVIAPVGHSMYKVGHIIYKVVV